tara:strand:+ start:139 stop:381 length:243 start_codon:yes stop_codon:yes gene_type:complete
MLIAKESYKIIQELKKKIYKKKFYYYNLKKSIASKTLMLIISEDFAFTLMNQNLLNSKEDNNVNKNKVKAKKFAKQKKKI